MRTGTQAKWEAGGIVMMVLVLAGQGGYGNLHAQVLVTNTGTHIEITNGAIFYVQGGVWLQNNATINNDGDLYVTTHTDPGTEDWINDASTTALTGTGTVYLSADGPQNITGQFSTTFYDLVLDGAGNTIKSLKGVDAYVTNTLQLNDEILDVDTHVLYLLNPDPSALMRTGPTMAPYTGSVTEGMVQASADVRNKGYFARVVQPANVYLFPVGYLDSNLFRPVEIEVMNLPEGQMEDTMYVRLVPGDPSIDGWARTRKDSMVVEVFDRYYFLIHDGKTPADRDERIRIYFDSLEFTPSGIAQWRLDRPDVGSGAPPAWSTRGFTADSVGVTHTPGALSYIEQDFTSRYANPGTEIFALATTIIPVSVQELFIPNLFTPNGDGVNDEWQVFGPVSEIYIVIWDRWGNKVFETTDINQTWDGTYNGKPVNSGVYAVYIRGTLLDGSSFEHQGYILLTR